MFAAACCVHAWLVPIEIAKILEQFEKIIFFTILHIFHAFWPFLEKLSMRISCFFRWKCFSVLSNGFHVKIVCWSNQKKFFGKKCQNFRHIFFKIAQTWAKISKINNFHKFLAFGISMGNTMNVSGHNAQGLIVVCPSCEWWELDAFCRLLPWFSTILGCFWAPGGWKKCFSNFFF